jgi:hypothetical protein
VQKVTRFLLDEPQSKLRSLPPQASPLINLYQLKSQKFRSFKPKMSHIKLLHQIAYRLIGTSRIAKNIELQNAYPVRVTAKRVTICTIAHLAP